MPTAYVATQKTARVGPNLTIIAGSFSWADPFVWVVGDTLELFTIPANCLIIDWTVVTDQGLDLTTGANIQLHDVAHSDWTGGYWLGNDWHANAADGATMRTPTFGARPVLWNTFYPEDDKFLIKVITLGDMPVPAGQWWGSMVLTQLTTQDTPYTTSPPA